MKLSEIRNKPICYTDTEHGKCHESLLRSYGIVEKVIELLEKETPHKVIIEIITDLQEAK